MPYHNVLKNEEGCIMALGLIVILIFCGMLTNLMSAIFGIGGGVLMVPIL